MLTQIELKNLLKYDLKTGIFIWVNKPAITSPIRIGDRAGSVGKNGYEVIRISNKAYSSHRLAFFLHERLFT